MQLSYCQDIFVKETDAVDRVIEQWRRERPDLDPSAKAVTARLVRAAAAASARFGEVFEPLGIRDGEYSALAAIRRSGAPYELAPSQLIDQLVVTSGGLSLMLDRLERKGMVQRRPNPDDRRSVLVGLTTRGLETIDEAMSQHATVEHELVDGLTDRECQQLARLLAKFLRTNDAA
jgi:DNA-binding MarR family transcriptional regulator